MGGFKGKKREADRKPRGRGPSDGRSPSTGPEREKRQKARTALAAAESVATGNGQVYREKPVGGFKSGGAQANSIEVRTTQVEAALFADDFAAAFLQWLGTVGADARNVGICFPVGSRVREIQRSQSGSGIHAYLFITDRMRQSCYFRCSTRKRSDRVRP